MMNMLVSTNQVASTQLCLYVNMVELQEGLPLCFLHKTRVKATSSLEMGFYVKIACRSYYETKPNQDNVKKLKPELRFTDLVFSLSHESGVHMVNWM